jgi:hypothetical protein
MEEEKCFLTLTCALDGDLLISLCLPLGSRGGQRPRNSTATHIGGYFLKKPVTTEPLGLIADLLYAFGWALWTGVVVVVFIQIIPEAKRRQFKQVLDAYEAARDEARASRAKRRKVMERLERVSEFGDAYTMPSRGGRDRSRARVFELSPEA